jgi:hypothetical protein
MTSPGTFVLLQQEGHLIQSCLTNGLTHLRNARLDTKGAFYIAFFQLSIGLERLMKASLIIDHMVNNHFVPPKKSQMQSYGHDLVSLFERLRLLSGTDTTRPLDSIVMGSVEYDILQMLSEFAKRTRYFNLDSLSSAQSNEDPLASWNSIIERILKEDIHERHVRRVDRQSQFLASELRGLAIIIGTDLEKRPLSLKDAMSLPRQHDLAARHATFHVFCIIQSLVRQLSEISHNADTVALASGLRMPPVPHMKEFFDFTYHEKRDVLRKKRWP